MAGDTSQRDSGFGLNQNQGFGKGGGFMTDNGAKDAMNFSYQSRLQNDQLAQQKYGIDKTAATQRYGIDAGNYQAGLGLEGQLAGYGSQERLGTLNAETQRLGLASQNYQAGLGLEGQKYQADTGYKTAQLTDSTNRYGIDATTGTQRYVADQNANTQRYATNANSQIAALQDSTNRYGIDQGYKTAQLNADTSRYGIDKNYATAQLQDSTNRYGIDNQLRQAQLGLQGQEYAADQNTKQAQIAADASKYPAQLKQQRFDQLFPFVQQQLGGTAAGLQGGGSPSTSGQGPAINAGPVYSENQIQQQVNAQRAANDQSTAGRIRDMNGDLGGRGYGANSPLAMALSQGYQNANLGANTEVERSTRQTAAGQNAQQVLAGQQAQEAQFASRQQEDIQRRQVAASKYNALLSALGGLMG